jgi:hypothetical protein
VASPWQTLSQKYNIYHRKKSENTIILSLFTMAKDNQKIQ